MITGILGGILTGGLIKEIEKLDRDSEVITENSKSPKRIYGDDVSAGEQIMLNLDLQTADRRSMERFEPTG